MCVQYTGKAVCILLIFLSVQSAIAFVEVDDIDQWPQERSYVVIAPKKILPSSDYTIFVDSNPLEENTNLSLTVAIQCASKEDSMEMSYYATLGTFLLSDRAESASILTPASLYSVNFEPCFLVLSNAANGREFERRELSLASTLNDPNESKIFLQLDKPAYKPLDTVCLRLVVLNKYNLPDLNPENIGVTFYDPKGVTMKRWPTDSNRNITMDQNGLIQLQLPLAEELVFGTWRIEVSANGKSLSKEFLIQKYVLPKFFLKFEVRPKPYITRGTSTLTVDVQAMYTYKKALKGQLRLVLLNGRYPNSGNVTKSMPLTNGKATFSFNPVTELGRGLVVTGQDLQLLANVTEARTGRFQTAVHVIPVFDKDPFKITWLNPVKFFKHGVPTVLEFAVSDYENMPVVDESSSAVTLESKLVSSTSVMQSESSAIPLNGIVKFALNIPSGVVFEYIRIKYKDTTLSIPAPRTLKTGNGPEAEYLNPVLVATPEELRRGSSVSVRIESAQLISDSKLSYILWSGREIVGFESKLQMEDGAISVHLPEDKPYAQLNLIVYSAAISENTKSVTFNCKDFQTKISGKFGVNF